MSTENFLSGTDRSYMALSSVPARSTSFRMSCDAAGIFEELPVATIVSVSRPDAGDISPLLLSYTIEVQYRQVREWLQNIGIGDHIVGMHHGDDSDDEALHFPNEGSIRNRHVPSTAALSIIRPSLGGQQTVADKAKVAMQGYLSHFLGNLDIVNFERSANF